MVRRYPHLASGPSRTSPPGTPTNSHTERFLDKVSDRIVLPLMAIGLSTPGVSRAICWVGSRILWRKMDKETDDMIHEAFDGQDEHLSKKERKAKRARMNAYFKQVEKEAQEERAQLKAEKKLMRKIRQPVKASRNRSDIDLSNPNRDRQA